MIKVFAFIVFLIFEGCVWGGNEPKCPGWKVGVAKTVITPDEPMWMAGYAFRTKPAEGTLHDLWAKALYLEDAFGNQALLVTTDLLGFPKAVSDRIRDNLWEKLGLSRSQIILNSSHTHSGPVLTGALSNIYPPFADREKVKTYTGWLIDQITEVCEKAREKEEPVTIYAQNGVVRFQVNRRNNREAKLTDLTELNGPNDFSVPVLKIEDTKGRVKAIVFGYACHPTVLNGYNWSGDYPGFAQIELEKKYKRATALFFQGGGGDQNPLPRHSVPLAKQYGEELASAVARVMEEDILELMPDLTTAYTEINLELNDLLTEAQLIEFKNGVEGYQKVWAESMLEKIRRDEAPGTSYPFPVQLWQMGDQVIVSLGGELLISYSIKLKKLLGSSLFVMGYSNDVMAYIPDEKVLMEGGYEGETSHMVYGMPSTWKPGIEEKIIGEVLKQVKLIRSSSE
jgi:hypothetical protein